MIAFIFMLLWATNPFIFKTAPILSDYSESRIFLLRFSIVSSINLLIYLVVDLIYSKEERISLVKENAALQYNKLDNEYKLLKAQINPHFLFNALNISKSLIRTQPKDAEKYIIGLSDFLRTSLSHQQKSVVLQKEIAHCQQYVALQKVRFGNAFIFTINVPDFYLGRRLPFFTLVTLVENAIKHNAFSEENPLEIEVSVIDNFLCIKNNIQTKKGVASTNIGLTNLNQRSKMLSGHGISIENDTQYFIVKIKLSQP